MRKVFCAGAASALLLAGCVGTPSLSGTAGAPSFSALQEMCGRGSADYGPDAQDVYSTFFDAYVAFKRHGISKERFCAFQGAIAERHAAYVATPGTQSQNAWASFFLDQRAQALSWRAAVDPTLRAG